MQSWFSIIGTGRWSVYPQMLFSLYDVLPRDFFNILCHLWCLPFEGLQLAALCFLNHKEHQTALWSAEACSCPNKWRMFSFTFLSLCGCLLPAHSYNTHLNSTFSSCAWAQHFRDERKRTAEDRGWEAVKSRKYNPSSCWGFFFFFSVSAEEHRSALFLWSVSKSKQIKATTGFL